MDALSWCGWWRKCGDFGRFGLHLIGLLLYVHVAPTAREHQRIQIVLEDLQENESGLDEESMLEDRIPPLTGPSRREVL